MRWWTIAGLVLAITGLALLLDGQSVLDLRKQAHFCEGVVTPSRGLAMVGGGPTLAPCTLYADGVMFGPFRVSTPLAPQPCDVAINTIPASGVFYIDANANFYVCVDGQLKRGQMAGTW